MLDPKEVSTNSRGWKSFGLSVLTTTVWKQKWIIVVISENSKKHVEMKNTPEQWAQRRNQMRDKPNVLSPKWQNKNNEPSLSHRKPITTTLWQTWNQNTSELETESVTIPQGHRAAESCIWEWIIRQISNSDSTPSTSNRFCVEKSMQSLSCNTKQKCCYLNYQQGCQSL